MKKENVEKLAKVAKRLGRARDAETKAWEEVIETVRDIYNGGEGSYEEIGELLGVTRARVYQLVNNKTKPRRPPHPIANKPLVDA